MSHQEEIDNSEPVVKYCYNCRKKTDHRFVQLGQGYYEAQCDDCGQINCFNAYTGARTTV